MMSRQQDIEGNNNNNNTNMNVSAHGNMNYAAGSRGGSGAGKTVGDHINRRFSHHGGDAPAGGGAPAPSAGGGASSAASSGSMGEYGGMSHQQYANRAGLSPGMGQFNPTTGMGAAGMNASLYPHLGASTAGLMQHQSQQAGLGELEYARGSSGAMANHPQTGAQADREEELLLNLLISRRARVQQGRPEAQQMGPGAGGAGSSWADEWMRLRQQEMGASGGAAADPYDGLQAEGSQRSRGSSSRMAGMGATGMGQMQNTGANMMAGAADVGQHQQMLSDPSARLQYPRGVAGMGMQMSTQGAWMGNAAASMHHMTDNAYAAQRSAGMGVFNQQLELDTLSRADPMMRPGMMHDARMAGEQGGMGQNPYHQYNMGRQQTFDRMTYGKRPLDASGFKGMEKVNPQMQQYFGSPQKPVEEAQPTKKRRSHKKKPADMPRRPLSAYNLFFSEERERILKEIEGKTGDKDEDESGKTGEESKPKALLRPLLPSEKKRRPHRKTHGKISFQELATKVGQRWKALPDDRRKYYQDLAQEDMKRQKKAMEEYYQKRSAGSALAVEPPATKD